MQKIYRQNDRRQTKCDQISSLELSAHSGELKVNKCPSEIIHIY
jgi:hypothetical protein